MDKVLIEVFVPALDRTYDLFIPAHPPLHRVLELIKKAVADLSDGRFVANEGTALCRREDGEILDINISVYELGIQNGSKLMLI